MSRGEDPLAEGADIPVQGVVVLLICLQCSEQLAAASSLAGELRHAGEETEGARMEGRTMITDA